MINTNIDFIKNKFDKAVSSCIKDDEVFNIALDEGNVILISEKNYNNLVESLELIKCYKDIKDVVDTPTEELSKDTPW